MMIRRNSTAKQGFQAALLAAVTTVGAAWGQETNKPLRFNAHLLQPGNGGAGSRTTSVAVGDVNGDGRSDLVIGGQLGGAMGQGSAPFIANALCNNEVIEGVIYTTLPDLGYGGTVNAISVPTNAGGDAAVCAAGSVYEQGGQPLPAWYAKFDGVVAFGVLPTLGGVGGEAFGIQAEWSHNGLIIVVCGKSLRMDGSAQATVWECAFKDGDPDNPVITTTFLDSLAEGADAGAMAIYIEELKFPINICGYSRNENGDSRAVYWEKTAGGWQPPQALKNLPGGDTARARGALTDGTSNTLLFAGTAENDMGKMVPTVWAADGNGHDSAKPLRLPVQFDRGRANGIIAILIGLLVPGEMTGPNGSAAALWTVNGQGNSAVLNLNALARRLPAGTVLRSANAILPYVEQDVCVVVGNATDSRGVLHGYVGTIVIKGTP